MPLALWWWLGGLGRARPSGRLRGSVGAWRQEKWDYSWLLATPFVPCRFPGRAERLKSRLGLGRAVAEGSGEESQPAESCGVGSAGSTGTPWERFHNVCGKIVVLANSLPPSAGRARALSPSPAGVFNTKADAAGRETWSRSTVGTLSVPGAGAGRAGGGGAVLGYFPSASQCPAGALRGAGAVGRTLPTWTRPEEGEPSLQPGLSSSCRGRFLALPISPGAARRRSSRSAALCLCGLCIISTNTVNAFCPAAVSSPPPCACPLCPF